MTAIDRAIALLTNRVTYATPGALAVDLEPKTVQTPALRVLDAAIVDAIEGRAPRLIFTMPPQEGKSQRVSRWTPLWALKRNPDLRIGLVSYADPLARRWGRSVRNLIQDHPELGLVVRGDTGAANEWQLAGYEGGMITAGIASSLTGRPVDLMIIDDPIKGREEADSEIMRENLRDFWAETASPRLNEGAPVIIIQTRWHEDDLAGQRIEDDPDGWRLINIPAQWDGSNKHPKTKAEMGDPIGPREIGEYMISARGRTASGWDQRKKDAGSRGWAAVYQGRPAPAEGGILKRAWWRWYDTRRYTMTPAGVCTAHGASAVAITVDAAFKDTKGSDFVVMQVWARRGARYWMLDQVRDRLDFPATISTLRALCAKWPQATVKLIEDKANGPAIISSLITEVGGIIPITPRNSKEARTSAVAPIVEAGGVELPRFEPWAHDFVEECAAFPNAAHDDQVDAFTQLIHRWAIVSGPADQFMDELMQERGGYESAAPWQGQLDELRNMDSAKSLAGLGYGSR